MIIFHTLPEIDLILQDIQFHDPRYEMYGLVDFTIFGQYQRGKLLNILPKEEYIPKEVQMEDTESAFDYWYWVQLETDPESFLEKLEFLRLEYLSGASLIIAIQVEQSPYRMSIVESLIGYIRAFYGLETKLILTPDDLIDPHFLEYSGFSVNGLCRLSEDLTRAALMKGESQ